MRFDNKEELFGVDNELVLEKLRLLSKLCGKHNGTSANWSRRLREVFLETWQEQGLGDMKSFYRAMARAPVDHLLAEIQCNQGSERRKLHISSKAIVNMLLSCAKQQVDHDEPSMADNQDCGRQYVDAVAHTSTNCRMLKKKQHPVKPARGGTKAKRARTPNENVNRRRHLVLSTAESNPKARKVRLDKMTCEALDKSRVEFPQKWNEHGVVTWVSAFQIPALKPRIHKMFSTDRRSVK